MLSGKTYVGSSSISGQKLEKQYASDLFLRKGYLLLSASVKSHLVHIFVSTGESLSSSASDVDSFNHQGVTDKSAKTKRSLSHVAGNLLPVARSQINFVPLLDFVSYPTFINYWHAIFQKASWVVSYLCCLSFEISTFPGL